MTQAYRCMIDERSRKSVNGNPAESISPPTEDIIRAVEMKQKDSRDVEVPVDAGLGRHPPHLSRASLHPHPPTLPTSGDQDSGYFILYDKGHPFFNVVPLLILPLSFCWTFSAVMFNRQHARSTNPRAVRPPHAITVS